MGRSEFDTHMDLESSDAILLKYLIQTMFEGIEFTINPHFMPINLEPFHYLCINSNELMR